MIDIELSIFNYHHFTAVHIFKYGKSGSGEIRSTKVKVLLLQDVLDGKISQSLPTEKCTKHLSELLNMYCPGDEPLGCTVCISVDHK